MGRRLPRDIRPPNIHLDGRDRARRVIDEDFEGVDLDAVTSCSLREQPITRLPAFGPALVELDLGSCKDLVTLEGIERCTSLAKLRLGYLSGLDLEAEFARFAELPELTWLQLAGMALPDNVAAPSLIELQLVNCPIDLVPIGTIATLRRLVLYGSDPWTLGDVDPIASTVTTLELNNVGAMPATLGVLAKLERLTIKRSRHLRKLPRDLGRLASLVELAIDAPIRTLDDSICKCSKLEVLDLSDTALARLPDEIGALARLRELRLLGTKISKIPASIGDLRELRVLSLPSAAEVPDSITRLSIETFHGSKETGARIPRRAPSIPVDDDLRFRVSDPLPPDFGDPVTLELAVPDDRGPVPQLANLRRLTRASLRVPALEAALVALAASPRLHHLSLHDVAVLPAAIGELDMLRTLNIAGTLSTLPEALGKLAQLETLGLWCRELVDVPASVAELPVLTTLFIELDSGELPDVRSRSLTNVTIQCKNRPASLTALARLPRLESLSVSGPIADLERLLGVLAATPIRHLELGRNAGRSLPSTISALAPTLTSLDLRRTDMTSLPYSLRECTHLTSVTLPCPEFGVDAVAKLPPIKWTKHKWADHVRFERSKRQ